jgi:hypothetical protein
MSLEMAKSVSFGRPFGLYREPPLNRAVGLSAACLRGCTGQSLQGHRTNVRCTLAVHVRTQLNVSRSLTTVTNRYLAVMPAPDKTAYTAPGTGQMSGASPPRAPSSTESSSPTGQTGTGQTPCPVLCPVRSTQRQTA